MRKIIYTSIILSIMTLTFLSGCVGQTAEDKTQLQVDQQQKQYNIAQPVPYFDWSLERSLLSQIYVARNQRVATYSVWRGYSGIIEGDCPSIGYPIPYGTSLTNPHQLSDPGYHDSAVIDQAEPNGLFPSSASQATWVMCTTKVNGRVVVAPVYVEDQVTAFPYPVIVNYTTNRVSPVENVMPSVTLNLNSNISIK
jgi:hypothetical protein